MKINSPSRIINRLRHAQIENKGLKLLSLALAGLLFAVSRQPVSDVYLRGVSIEYRGLGPGIEIVSDPNQASSAGLRLRGPRDVVRNLLSNQLVLVADLTNKELGERLIYLASDDRSLPDNTTVVGIDPPSIKIKLEKTIRKTVGIEPQYIGQIPEGSELYDSHLSPQSIEIEGPQSIVEKTNLLYTESITLSGRREAFKAAVAVEPPNSSIRLRTSATVNISLAIGEQRTSRKMPNVQVLWPDHPPGGRLLTRTVEVELYGPASIVQALRPESITAEIKSSDIAAGAESAAPRIKLPFEADPLITIKSIYPKGVKVKKP